MPAITKSICTTYHKQRGKEIATQVMSPYLRQIKHAPQDDFICDNQYNRDDQKTDRFPRPLTYTVNYDKNLIQRCYLTILAVRPQKSRADCKTIDLMAYV